MRTEPVVGKLNSCQATAKYYTHLFAGRALDDDDLRDLDARVNRFAEARGIPKSEAATFLAAIHWHSSP